MEKLPDELIWLIYTYIPRPAFIYELKRIRVLKNIEKEIDESLNAFMAIYYGEHVEEELCLNYEELLSEYIENLYPIYKSYYDLPIFVYM